MKMHIENPSIPFEQHFHSHFHHGQTITIKGKAKYHHDHDQRFVINLGIEPDHHHNVALHFNPRHDEKQIVLNTKVGGAWGHEERVHNHIHDGEHFELKIKAHHSHYDIKVNGEHVAEYQYRVPAPMVNHIEIYGGVHIDHIKIEEH